MNRLPKECSDSDWNGGVLGEGTAKNKAVVDLSEQAAQIGLAAKVSSSCQASSIRSSIIHEEVKDVATPDRHLSASVVDSPNSRNSSPRSRYDGSESDPYKAVRVAGTCKNSALGSSYPYSSLRIAASPRIRIKSSTCWNHGSIADSYVRLKIAASSRSVNNGEEIVSDSNDSSGTEEDSEGSGGSAYGQVQVEDLSENGGEFGSKNVDADFPTNCAIVSAAGSKSERRKDIRLFDGCANISVAGSTAEYGKDAGGEFSGYGRVSVSGSDPENVKNGDEECSGYARVSVTGSGVDNGRDVSNAGSENNHGKGMYAKVGDGDFIGYARVCFPGSDFDHGKDGYARVSVAGYEAEYGEDIDRDVSGYARLTVMQSKDDHETVDMVGSGFKSLQHGIGDLCNKEQLCPVSKSQDKDQESWNSECATYMELNSEVRARLQYRVRVILISPLFELKERKLSAFSDLYKSRFGEDVEWTGFSSVANLSRAMPNVVQRKELEDNGVLVLADCSENRRAVSGIRSGLRRIVYDALTSLDEEFTYSQLEEKCSELLGKPLVEVMSEHGYDKADVESLVKDMPDIAGFDFTGLEPRVFLCMRAEDPALTDGLLIKSTAVVSVDTSKLAECKRVISEVEYARKTGKESENLSTPRESLKIGSLVTLRSLKNELRRFGSFSQPSGRSLGDEILQVRLHMRILLAFCNSGHGVEVRKLSELYEKTFGRSVNLQELGFKSPLELARHWQDIFLLEEPKPDWVFLVPSQANRRILNTLRTGLRSSVFSVLAETYPEGLDLLDFLHRLQEGMSGELWDVLDTTGYICFDAEKADIILSCSSSSDFQLVDFEEICVLLDDMIDFVRLGSDEDGSVVVRLRNGEVPLVDLLDCKMVNTDVGGFDELFVNLMMIAVDVTETSGADDGSSENGGGFINMGHVLSLVKSFEGSGGLRSAHLQAPDFERLKHEFRLILGCPQYCDSGLPLNELSKIYKDRTGLGLGSKAKIKSLLRAMPDIVCKVSLTSGSVHLSKTPKNLRILSVTRAGLRQVLFWASVKNPGGVWANLLEGWFTDFAGMSLAATLQMHGYEMSKSRPFFPVHVFLRDMSDLLQKKSASFELYAWADEVKDPVHMDANLLGLSELMIQYDPLRELEVPRREAELVDNVVDKPALNKKKCWRGAYMINDGVIGNFRLKQGNFNVEAGLEVEQASMKEDAIYGEAKFDHGYLDTTLMEERRRNEIYLADSQAGDELGSENFVGPVRDYEVYCHGHTGAVDKGENGREVVDEFMKDGTNGEQFPADSSSGDVSDGGGNEFAEDDDSYLPKSELGGWNMEGDRSESTSEVYAQLRVAGKGPKTNLDEWQFTDTEDGEEDDEVENDFQEEESSDTGSSCQDHGQTLPPISYLGAEVEESGASKIWVLPENVILWK